MNVVLLISTIGYEIYIDGKFLVLNFMIRNLLKNEGICWTKLSGSCFYFTASICLNFILKNKNVSENCDACFCLILFFFFFTNEEKNLKNIHGSIRKSSCCANRHWHKASKYTYLYIRNVISRCLLFLINIHSLSLFSAI